MNCGLYNEMMQQFHDGELEKAKEPFIFTHLAECEECREFFKSMSLISSSIQIEVKDFPQRIDEKIFGKIRTISDKNSLLFSPKKIPTLVSCALAIIIIIMSVFIFDSEMEYKQEMHLALKQIRYQNERINLLMNTMPEVRVRSKLSDVTIIQGNRQVTQ